ncbi:PREDICTED: putative FBD-associated F-box protein At5g56700 [Prunus mume]|uniref:FBD-associated F-box protein At5g56700 n=1 Tax=Prunus mume TaxID=102107 RepID=A0ABM0P8Y0_PRUMU|nr:PREDICTED: putative FBD-associated F-box protein At5g56700 [Prunus mume]
MDQSDSVPLVKYECNLGKRHRRSEGNNSGKRRRRCEGKNSGKNEKEKGAYNLVDRISEMTDEILVSILSLLSLKEAAATSILSRRWQYVWMSTMVLNFNANFDIHRNLCRFIALKRKLRYLESGRYVNWVNRVVEQHRGPNIEEFRACFQLNDRFASSIDKWIQFAMEKGVKTLVLKFNTQCGVASKNFYVFPHKLLGLEKKHVYSYIPSLRPCGCKVGFQFLKVLHFQCVDMTDKVFEYFLSNCPVLERLTLLETKSLVNLRVIRPSVALKHLVIGICVGLQSIEICDANLVSFVCKNSENVLLSNVLLLVEVSMSNLSNPRAFIELFSRQLSCCLSQLEILILNITGAEHNPKHVFPILANLKHLELIVLADYRLALFHLTSFLKASPFLQRLVLKLDFIILWEDLGEINKAVKCPHHSLKVVEIVGYRARASAVEHIMFLIKSAVALEKIVIDPLRRWEAGSEDFADEAKAREHAVQLVKKKLPSTVEFVCL